MRSFLVIMIHERADGGSEVLLAEWHDSIQTLGFDGPNKSLGKRVQIGTPGRQAQGLHTTVPQQVPEGCGVEGIAVQNEVFVPRRKPSSASIRFRAICVIQFSSG
jgi:hypothetical protein